jgi:putative PIN family toxin of toxin-antitoxin system
VKVVLDTNIHVSALVIPGGAAERVIRMAIEGAFDVAISRPILDELLGVLSRKFSREAEELARTAIFLSSFAEMVAPAERIRVLSEADNRILECATAAAAGFIVTGDREILTLGTWQGVEILSLRQFLARLGREAMQPRAEYALSSQDLAFLSKLLRKRRVGVRPPARPARPPGLPQGALALLLFLLELLGELTLPLRERGFGHGHVSERRSAQ